MLDFDIDCLMSPRPQSRLTMSRNSRFVEVSPLKDGCHETCANMASVSTLTRFGCIAAASSS